jgi:hypothetical protein
MRDYTTGIVLTGDARQTTAQKAADLYSQGCTIRSVAHQIGRSYGGTRVLLLEAGVQPRGRGGSVGRKAAI